MSFFFLWYLQSFLLLKPSESLGARVYPKWKSEWGKTSCAIKQGCQESAPVSNWLNELECHTLRRPKKYCILIYLKKNPSCDWGIFTCLKWHYWCNIPVKWNTQISVKQKWKPEVWRWAKHLSLHIGNNKETDLKTHVHTCRRIRGRVEQNGRWKQENV